MSFLVAQTNIFVLCCIIESDSSRFKMQYILSVTTRGASLYVSGKKVLAIKIKVDTEVFYFINMKYLYLLFGWIESFCNKVSTYCFWCT